MSNWQAAVAAAISAQLGKDFLIEKVQPLAGGDINRAWLIAGAGQRYFVKLNSAALLPMFAAEAAGLQALAAAQAVRVPAVMCSGHNATDAWLVLEAMDFVQGAKKSATLFGEQLALLHRATAPAFGWQQDNTIGSTAQPNGWRDDWIAFWREQRLGFQLQLAASHGYGGSLQTQGALLLEALPALLDHAPRPSLLHGDLWGGNWAVTATGEPVIFDPAVYYGDRETDLAMTHLFGGFPADFYAAYEAAWPLPAGHAVRRTLYNLYHILNHLNLFGAGYRHQAEEMIGRLLSEVRG
jgi:fructosamine-3-kinase